MNKNYDSFINKAVIFGLVVGGFAIAALAVKPSQPEVEIPKQSLDVSTRQAFEFELQKSLNLNHTETITAIELQNATLNRIENAILALGEAQQEEEKKAEPAPIATLQKPIRASSTRWTVEGQRNYSDDFLAAHLAEDHGFEAFGYSREDMQSIHDNLHNGYSALGTGTVQKTTSPGVRYTTRPTRRVFRTYSTCPTGGCP